MSTDGTPKSFESDKVLGDKLRGLVGALDQHANKCWDETSERLWGAALVMGTEKNFSGQDDLQLAFNKPTEQYAAGEILHLFRAGPNTSPDPYANRAHMLTTEALSVPIEQRYQQAKSIVLAQAEQKDLAQQEMTRGPDDPSKGGPKLTM
jgi:hypothetical protein